MSDQAQGLRALADQVRGEPASPSFSAGGRAVEIHPGPIRDCQLLPETTETELSTNVALADIRRHRSISTSPASPLARVIAVTSGKGGVGKSNFSTNFSLALGQIGQKVIILDADLGLANLHLLLGVAPRYNLEHVMRGKKTLCETLHDCPCGVRLIAGGSGLVELANLTEAMRQGFIIGMQELDQEADLILIDTGAGVARNVLAFLCAVDEIVILTTPEPTAITDAYATIKVVSQENPTARMMLVVNMVNSSGEGQAVADRLTTIARQFLNVTIDYLGCIPLDPAVTKAVRQREPFMLTQPGCSASRAIQGIIGKLGYRPKENLRSGVEQFLNRIQSFFGR